MNDPLESDLQRWAERHSLSEGEAAEALRQRIRNAVRSESLSDPEPMESAPARIAPNPWPGRLVWASLGALAASLLFLVIPQFNQSAPSNSEAASAFEDPQVAAVLRKLADDDEARKVFREVEHLFSGESSWIISLDDDLGLGLADSPPTEEVEAYQMQYVLLSQPEGGEWNVAWRGDIVSRSPHVADEERDLFLFIQPLEEGLYAVEQHLRLPSPAALRPEGLHLLRENEPIEIARLDRGDSHLRLYQTIRRLSDSGHSEGPS